MFHFQIIVSIKQVQNKKIQKGLSGIYSAQKNREPIITSKIEKISPVIYV